MDVLLSATALVCLSPVFLATAAAIKIEDKGPVFFSQPRAGKDMKPFRIYKFRSMRTDADEKLSEMLKDNEQTGHAFKIKDDPRITKVGKVIRRFSIDESASVDQHYQGGYEHCRTKADFDFSDGRVQSV